MQNFFCAIIWNMSVIKCGAYIDVNYEIGGTLRSYWESNLLPVKSKDVAKIPECRRCLDPSGNLVVGRFCDFDIAVYENLSLEPQERVVSVE